MNCPGLAILSLWESAGWRGFSTGWGHPHPSGAWRKSPYSSENAFTRQNRDFPLAKLARQLRCAALAAQQASEVLALPLFRLLVIPKTPLLTAKFRGVDRPAPV